MPDPWSSRSRRPCNHDGRHTLGICVDRGIAGLETRQARRLEAGEPLDPAGIFGVICFIGLTILLARRLFNPRIRATSSGRDILILVLLYIQLILGLSSIFVSAGHMDGAQMIALGEWAQHIVTFRGGAATYIADAHWIFKTHVFLGMTLILLTPFTRLVHVWSIPVGYLTRPYQVVRKRQRPLQYPVR